MQVSVTFRGDLKKELHDFLVEVTDEVFKDARANTPIRSGNARKGWTKEMSVQKGTVENKVPYIGRLEAGASRQAPRGIIGPTLTQVKGKYK